MVLAALALLITGAALGILTLIGGLVSRLPSTLHFSHLQLDCGRACC